MHFKSRNVTTKQFYVVQEGQLRGQFTGYATALEDHWYIPSLNLVGKENIHLFTSFSRAVDACKK